MREEVEKDRATLKEAVCCTEMFQSVVEHIVKASYEIRRDGRGGGAASG